VNVVDPPVTVVARPKPKRLRYIVAGGLCAAAVLFLLVGGLSRNIVYFRTASEAVKNRTAEGTHRFRLMGAVVNGSDQRTADGVAFDVTDGTARVKVVHRGDPPELFKGGIPVVCEGHWEGDTFQSDRIMIKHGAEYRPPAVDASK
jgi:cytochrome c-type biogenesis protein CcmE